MRNVRPICRTKIGSATWRAGSNPLTDYGGVYSKGGKGARQKMGGSQRRTCSVSAHADGHALLTHGHICVGKVV